MSLPPSSYLAFGATSLGKHRPLSGVCNSFTSQTAVSEIKFWSYNLHTHQTAIVERKQVSYYIFVRIDLHLNSSLAPFFLVALIYEGKQSSLSLLGHRLNFLAEDLHDMTVFGRNMARPFDKDGKCLCRNIARTVPSIFGRK